MAIFSVDGMFPGGSQMWNTNNKFKYYLADANLRATFNLYRKMWRHLDKRTPVYDKIILDLDRASEYHEINLDRIYNYLIDMLSSSGTSIMLEWIKERSVKLNTTDELVYFTICIVNWPQLAISTLEWWYNLNVDRMDRASFEKTYFKFLIRGCRSGNVEFVKYIIDSYSVNIDGEHTVMGALWYIHSFGFDDTTESNRTQVNNIRYDIATILLLKGAKPDKLRKTDYLTPIGNFIEIGDGRLLRAIFNLKPELASKPITVYDKLLGDYVNDDMFGDWKVSLLIHEISPIVYACSGTDRETIETIIDYIGVTYNLMWLIVQNKNTTAISVMIEKCKDPDIVRETIRLCNSNNPYYNDILQEIRKWVHHYKIAVEGPMVHSLCSYTDKRIAPP